MRFSGELMPTISSISAACRLASFLVRLRCNRVISIICCWTVINGFSAVMGSWKIIAILRPRIDCSLRSFIVNKSSPPKTARPPSMRPGGLGTKPITAKLVTLLPLPDSPTRPTVSPGATSNETPRTARTLPSSVLKLTCRSSTLRIGVGMRISLGSSFSGPRRHADRRPKSSARKASSPAKRRGTRPATNKA